MRCSEAFHLSGVLDHSREADDAELLAIAGGIFGMAVVDVATQRAVEVDFGGVGEGFAGFYIVE